MKKSTKYLLIVGIIALILESDVFSRVSEKETPIEYTPRAISLGDVCHKVKMFSTWRAHGSIVEVTVVSCTISGKHELLDGDILPQTFSINIWRHVVQCADSSMFTCAPVKQT